MQCILPSFGYEYAYALQKLKVDVRSRLTGWLMWAGITSLPITNLFGSRNIILTNLIFQYQRSMIEIYPIVLWNPKNVFRTNFPFYVIFENNFQWTNYILRLRVNNLIIYGLKSMNRNHIFISVWKLNGTVITVEQNKSKQLIYMSYHSHNSSPIIPVIKE